MDTIAVYGIMMPKEDEKKAAKERIFNYIKALIEAERLNPEPDFDNERELGLLQKITVCECNAYQRRQLAKMLGIWNGDIDE
jgi:hypothetical protein